MAPFILRRLCRRVPTRPSRQPQSRLALVTLERRDVPATIAWDGGPSGNGTDWLTAVNWAGDVLPGANDDVTFGPTGTNPAIALIRSTSVRSVVNNRSLRVESDSGVAQVTLGVSAGLTNNSLFELTSTAGVVNTFLNVSGGTLTNAAGGTFNSVPGTGGARFVTLGSGVTFVNQGAVGTGAFLDIDTGGNGSSFDTSGAVTIPAGGTFQPGSVFNFLGGTVVGGGNLDLTSTTANLTPGLTVGPALGLAFQNTNVNGPGTLAVAAGATLISRGGTVNAPFVNNGTLLARGSTTFNGSVTTPAASVIRVESSNQGAQVTLAFSAGLTNGGLIELTSTAGVVNAFLNVSGGTLTNAAGGTLSSLPGTGGARFVNFGNGVDFVNQGTVNAGASIDIVTGGGGTVTNNGTFAVAANQALNVGPLTNFNGTTLTGGTYDIAGTFRFPNAAINALAANLSLTGADANVQNTAGANALANLNAIAAAGRFALDGNRAFFAAGDFTNAGILVVNAGSTFAAAAGLANVAGGTLGGNGTVVAAVSGAGTVSPGSSPGTLTVNGAVTLNGPLAMELAGPGESTEFDQLFVNGTVTLAGATLVATRNFPTLPGAVFPIIVNDGTDAIVGTFAGLDQGATVTIGNRPFRVSYVGGTGNDVTLTQLNSAPALAVIGNRTVAEGTSLTLTAAATDVDAPPQALTYSLDAGAPAGAAIDPTTGVFTWTPPDGPANVSITVRVSDNGSPALSATRTFTVAVTNVAPTATSLTGTALVATGGTATFTLNGVFDPSPVDVLTYSFDFNDDGTFEVVNAASPTASTTYAAPGTFTVRGRVSDDDGGQNDYTTQVTVVPPARVGTVAVNAGQTNAAQRSRVTSVTVTFDSVVTFAGAVANAFGLSRIGGGAVGGFTATASVVGGVTVVTLSGFTGAETQFGSLADGRFSALVRANQVSANGAGLDGDGNGTGGDDFTQNGTTTNGLFRLFGDVDGDGTVNAFDFGQFRPAFGTSTGNPLYRDYLDFNNDGSVNAADFAQFRTRFGASVP